MVAEIETMRQMRQSGANLRQIASHFGISHETVRQRLSGVTSDKITTAEIARLAGCSKGYIKKLKRQGVIQPAVASRRRTLWSPDTIATIIIYNDGQRCPVCHQPVPVNRHIYCSRRCYLEAHRYKNSPEPARRRQRESTARWKANHPEQAKEIDQRKGKRYQAKKSAERYQNTEYIVWRRGNIPLGTIVRVLSGNKGKGTLNVEWDGQILEVPFTCVKKSEKKLTQGLTKG